MSSFTRRGSNKKRVVLSPEALEDRDVPAGGVSAFVSGGVLQITGDAADNKIWVMGLGNGTAVVAPLDNTTINGVQGPQILGGIAFAYNIQLGDGNDFLYVSNTSGNTSLFVSMGNGNDGLAVDFAKNSAANFLAMGAGNDAISMGMGKLMGFTTFDLGPGKNRINIAATEFGGVAFRGSGADSLGLLAVNFHSVPIMSGISPVYSTMTPSANNDRATARHGTSTTIDVAANDTAPGNTIDKSSVRITKQPAHGTVSVNADGTITFSADSSTATFDSFKYTIRNSSGAESNEATVTLAFHTTPDTTGPVPTITNTGGNTTNLASIPFTVTFNEDVTGFSQTDVILTNGTLSGFTAVNPRTFTFNVAPIADGAVVVSLAAGAAEDAAGNDSVAATRTVTSDRTPPTATITTPTNPTSAASIPVTVTFSENVTGFVAADLVVTNGAVSGFTAVNGSTYTFNVAPTGTGSVQITVNVAASVATDAAGNGNTAATELTIVSDQSALTVNISTTASNPTNLAAIPFTAQFSNTVNNFVAADVTVTGGTLSNFVAVDGDTYTFSVIPTADGTVTVSIAAGVATDTSGNSNTAATPVAITSDRTVPTAVVSSTVSGTTSISPIPFTVTFSEDVSGFSAGDIVVTNGAVSGFTIVNDSTYNFTVIPSGAGVDVSVSVPAGAAQDDATNGNTVSNTVTVTFSGSVVTATIAAGPTVTDPTNLAAITLTVTFSEDVTGFDETDLNFTNGTLQAGSFSPVDGHTFTFILVPTADGPVTVNIPAGAATGASGSTSAASFTITSDRSAPTATVTTATNPTNASPIVFTVTFNEDVTGLVVGALSATGGTIGAITSLNARTFTVEVTPTADGTVTLTVLSGQVTDLVGNATTADFTGTVASDRTNPTVAVNTTSATAGVITGTSSDTSGATGVTEVRVSISNGTNFWDGTAFASATEQFFDATSTDNFATWSLAFTTPGTYTVHAIATDTADNDGESTNNAVEVT